MLVSHEVPKTLLNDSLKFNDYDYFLIHQIINFKEYKDFFNVSKKLNRRQILDNSCYELKESFDFDKFADFVKELKPSEYLIPDCFNDKEKNLELFDKWMTKYSNLEGTKIVTLHGKTISDFIESYKYFDNYNVKIAFNFAETLYKEYGSLSEGRKKVFKNLLPVINQNKKHHLLGCYLPQDFVFFKNFSFIETIDTSSPICSAFELKKYPISEKPKITIDEVQNTVPTIEIMKLINYNTFYFKKYTR